MIASKESVLKGLKRAREYTDSEISKISSLKATGLRPIRTSPLKPYGIQPSCDDITSHSIFNIINATYTQLIGFIDSVIEPFPDYVTKHSIGKDSSPDNLDMFAYDLTPKFYSQHILLVGGMHGGELDSIGFIARLMMLLVNNDQDEDIQYIRNNVRVSIVPCACPWGYTNKVNNGYNGGVMQAFASESPIAEVTNLKSYISSLADTLSFVADLHTTRTRTTNYGNFYGIIQKHAPNVRTIMRTREWLSERFADENWISENFSDSAFVIRYQFDEHGTVEGVGYRNTTSTLNYWCYNVLGIPSCTLEFSDWFWYNYRGTLVTQTIAFTMYMNYIVQMINDGYRSIADIDEEDYKEVRG